MTPLKENIIDFAEQDLIKIVGNADKDGVLFNSLNELLQEKHADEKRVIPLDKPILEFNRKTLPELYNKYESNKHLISELRKHKPEIMRDRTVYYSTSPVRKTTDKPYKLQAVYSMWMANYEFQIQRDEPEMYRYNWRRSSSNTSKNTNKNLTFIYFNIQKTQQSFDTQTINRFYIIRNLHTPEKLPDELRERLFNKLFQGP